MAPARIDSSGKVRVDLRLPPQGLSDSFRRGDGRSGRPWQGNNMDTHADDLATLVEALHLQNAVRGTCSTTAKSKMGRIYAVAMSKRGTVYYQRVHAIDLARGQEVPESSVVNFP
jgi:hypothetical protein